MKWCFLVAYNPIFTEFLGKLSHQVVKEGNSCVLVYISKIAEYSQRQYFTEEAQFISRVDWCRNNYQEGKTDFGNVSWKEFFADYERFRLQKSGFEKSIEIISQDCQFVDAFLREEKPDVVVFEPPSGTISEVFYLFCQKYNIRYLGLMYSKIGGKTDVRDLKYTCSKYEKDFQDYNVLSEKERDAAKSFLPEFISHKKIPPYARPEKINRKETAILKTYIKKSIKMLPFWLEYILKRNRFKYFDYRSEMQLKRRVNYPFHALKVRFKKLIQERNFASLNKEDKFFIFPLQFQPEASTLVSATYFYDQINTIKNIAFALPLPYKLCVKDHPKVKGDRPWGFYKKIKQIPNVALVPISENVENLIKKSEGVITLSSTVGLEAALSGKPVYVLGNVFYSYHPMCRKIKSFEELKEKIKADLAQKPFLPDLSETNLRFIISYFRNIVTGDIDSAVKENDVNDYQRIYQEIKKLFLC